MRKPAVLFSKYYTIKTFLDFVNNLDSRQIANFLKDHEHFLLSLSNSEDIFTVILGILGTIREKFNKMSMVDLTSQMIEIGKLCTHFINVHPNKRIPIKNLLELLTKLNACNPFGFASLENYSTDFEKVVGRIMSHLLSQRENTFENAEDLVKFLPFLPLEEQLLCAQKFRNIIKNGADLKVMIDGLSFSRMRSFIQEQEKFWRNSDPNESRYDKESFVDVMGILDPKGLVEFWERHQSFLFQSSKPDEIFQLILGLLKVIRNKLTSFSEEKRDLEFVKKEIIKLVKHYISNFPQGCVNINVFPNLFYSLDECFLDDLGSHLPEHVAALLSDYHTLILLVRRMCLAAMMDPSENAEDVVKVLSPLSSKIWLPIAQLAQLWKATLKECVELTRVLTCLTEFSIEFDEKELISSLEQLANLIQNGENLKDIVPLLPDNSRYPFVRQQEEYWINLDPKAARYDHQSFLAVMQVLLVENLSDFLKSRSLLLAFANPDDILQLLLGILKLILKKVCAHTITKEELEALNGEVNGLFKDYINAFQDARLPIKDLLKVLVGLREGMITNLDYFKSADEALILRTYNGNLINLVLVGCFARQGSFENVKDLVSVLPILPHSHRLDFAESCRTAIKTPTDLAEVLHCLDFSCSHYPIEPPMLSKEENKLYNNNLVSFAKQSVHLLQTGEDLLQVFIELPYTCHLAFIKITELHWARIACRIAFSLCSIAQGSPFGNFYRNGGKPLLKLILIMKEALEEKVDCRKAFLLGSKDNDSPIFALFSNGGKALIPKIFEMKEAMENEDASKGPDAPLFSK